MIETAFHYVMANWMAFAIGAMFVIALGSITAIICMSLAMRGLHIALRELKRARIDIRTHSPLHADKAEPYEERLKKEYEKRGIPWETIGK